jgi:hypothetical protein
MRLMWTYNHEALYLSKGCIRFSILGPEGFKNLRMNKLKQEDAPRCNTLPGLKKFLSSLALITRNPRMLGLDLPLVS